MKRIYCFDFDNTIYSRKKRMVYLGTFKLFDELKKSPDNILVLATGRRPFEIPLLVELKKYFDYFIFFNGAVIYHHDKIIYKNPLSEPDIIKVIEKAKKIKRPIGLTSINDEYIVSLTDEAKEKWDLPKGYQEIKSFREISSIDIYQLWMLESNRDIISEFIHDFVNYRTFFWHQGGAHFVKKDLSKAFSLQIIKDKYLDYQLIAIGDGHNDIEMICLADIGIAVKNSSDTELKEKANLIAYDIEEDKLYDFYLENKLF